MIPFWTIQKAEEFDLYVYAREVLDIAIQEFKNDGYLDSAAFVVTKSEIHCLSVSFGGQDEKEAAYREIVGYAREVHAVAIVTLNDAFIGPAEAAQDYYPGKLKDMGAGSAIYVTASGPGLKNWSVQAKYENEGGQIRIQLPEEEFGGQLNLLQDWADNIKSVN